MPRYGNINERRHQLHEVIRLSGMNLVVNDLDMPLLLKLVYLKNGYRFILLTMMNILKGKQHLHEEGVMYADNDERAIFLQKELLRP
jgi:starch synthase